MSDAQTPLHEEQEKEHHVDRSTKDVVAHGMGLHTPFPRRIRPGQRPKVGLLALFTIGSAALMWFCLHGLLGVQFGSSTAFDIWFWSIASFSSFFLTIACVAIVALLVHEEVIARSIFVLTALMYLVWFRFGWYTFLSLSIILLGLWIYDWQIKEEESLRIRFSTAKSMRHGLTAIIALHLLAVSLTFYAKTIHGHPLAGSNLNPLAEIGGNTANQVIGLQVSGYDPKEKLDDVLLGMMAQQIQALQQGTLEEALPHVDLSQLDLTKPGDFVQQISNIDFSPVIELLPNEVQQQITQSPEDIATILAVQSDSAFQREYVRFRTSLLNELSIEADGTTPIGDVVKQLVASQISRLLGPYDYFVPPLLALTIFFSLSIFTFLYAAIIKLFAVTLFGIIKATKFITIHTVTTDVEIASLSD